MPYAPGTRLGPYEILSGIGAGGMGEVYKAKDPKLDRMVAIKVLPEHLTKDADALARFEREAKALASLQHPNVLGIFDFGTDQDIAYAVMELLEGETLRSLLSSGPIQQRRALEIAVQIAHGLSAAHGKGIIHRDLKPENIFVMKDGRVRILDFGLAKQLKSVDVDAPTRALGTNNSTEKGTILGTMGYMSPEQVRGEAVDARSDIFSFGVVLFEMLTGKKAFSRDTASDTMAAILRDDPPASDESGSVIPPPLRRIVDHCLEKLPARRFHDTHDLAFALENLSGNWSSSFTAPNPVSWRPPTWQRALWVALGTLIVSLGGWGLFTWVSKPQVPTIRQLTYRRPRTTAARFHPDGRSIVYSADQGSEPSELFAINLDGTMNRSLGIKAAEILSVSATGELAILRKSKSQLGSSLALVPADGGAPREIRDDVAEALWLPDGRELACIRDVFASSEKMLVELPMGHKVHEITGYTLLLRNLAIAPDGDAVAFFEEQIDQDSLLLRVVGRDGRSRGAFKVLPRSHGLVWTRGGLRWVENPVGQGSRIMASAPDGSHRRVLYACPSALQILDISKEGVCLISQVQRVQGLRWSGAGSAEELDFQWKGSVRVSDISRDGTQVLFDENGIRSFCLSSQSKDPMDLGAGIHPVFSNDGRSVLAVDPATQSAKLKMRMIPLGAGEAKDLQTTFNGLYYGGYSFLPGDKRIRVSEESGGPSIVGTYLQDLQTGESRRISPMRTYGPASPNGSSMIGFEREDYESAFLISLLDGSKNPLPTWPKKAFPLAWSADSKSVYFSSNPTRQSLAVHRLELRTGQVVLWKALAPSGAEDVVFVGPMAMSPDAKAYAYTYVKRIPSDLFIMEGLK